MLARHLVSLVLASTVAVCGALTGCAAQTSEPEDEPFVEGSGDGDGADEIVSERQLNGNELPDKTISLTFDDGPGPRTKELADYLGAEGVPATFFINGK